MEAEEAAFEEETVALSGAGGADTRGKNMIIAELGRVEQEVKFLEKELEEAEQTDNLSTVWEELLHMIETRPDPLLPLTNGPFDLSWDRWFEGPKGAHGCRCFIL